MSKLRPLLSIDNSVIRRFLGRIAVGVTYLWCMLCLPLSSYEWGFGEARGVSVVACIVPCHGRVVVERFVHFDNKVHL